MGFPLGLLQVGQAVPHLLPEERVPPLQHNVVLQQQPQVWIKLARVEAAHKYKDHLLAALVDRLQQARLEIIPCPLGFEKVLTEDNDGSLRGFTGSYNRVRDYCVGWQVSVMETDSVLAGHLEVMGEDLAHWALPWLNPRTVIEEEEEEEKPAIELHEFTPLKLPPASKRPADQVSPVAGVLWEGVDPSQLDGPGTPLAFPTEVA